MVRKTCISFCKCVFISLCIASINGQTHSASNATQAAVASEPGVDNIYQTDGFNTVNVKSGPILIIDKKTLFISDVNYNSRDNDANFWVGVGEPSSQGVLVPDENNSERPLKTYQGQNIYLQLPNNLTSDRIDYIAVWSEKNKTDLGHVKLYQNSSYTVRNSIPEATGFHNKTRENKTIFRIPGCCGRNELHVNRTCIKAEGNVPISLKVFKSNATHIDPEDLEDDIEFVTYKYYMQCPSVGYDAFVIDNNDAPGLIYNGSLIYYFDGYDHGLLPHGPFCIAHNDTATQKIYLCLKSVEKQTASIQYLYFPFLVISTLCFIGSAIIYIFILKAKDVHKKCFVGYSLSMAVTFIALICLQKLNSACNLTGGLFVFAMMCSFVWLACLCLDLIFVIKSANYLDQTRIYVYLALSFAIPTIILLFSIVPDGIPDVPNSFVKSYYGTHTCSFGEVKIAAFFIPVGLLITVSLVGLGYTSYTINTRKDPADFDWIRNKAHFKFMLIQCLMIYIIMIISYIVWLVLNLIDTDETPEGFFLPLILLQYMQGLLITLIIFGHNWGNKVIEKKKNKCNKGLNFEMKPLNGQRI